MRKKYLELSALRWSKRKRKKRERKWQCESERNEVEVNLAAEDGRDRRRRRERPPQNRYVVGERCWGKETVQREKKKKKKRKRIRILDLERKRHFKWFFCWLLWISVRECAQCIKLYTIDDSLQHCSSSYEKRLCALCCSLRFGVILAHQLSFTFTQIFKTPQKKIFFTTFS